MCGPQPPPKPPTPPPPTVTTHHLTVGAKTANPFPPSLTDDTGFTSITEGADQNTTTIVGPGDTMIWQISGDVSSIVAITDDTLNVNLFSSGPAAMNDGTGRWSGVIGNFPPGTTEAYSITYNVNGAPENPYAQDPKLSMKT
jgi:hypothetical protein